MVDIAVVLFLIGAAMSVSGPLSRRVVASYQLTSAVQTLVSDLAQTKIRAIQSNAVSTVRRESDRDYRAANHPRRLPGMVRFESSSTDSVAYNGLGAVTDGAAHVFVLENVFGEAREVRVYAAGGHEVRKL
jgi:Tfp pilus assembly protein FimT